MPYWPNDLPVAPLVAGFQIQPKPNVIAFGTEVGPGKVRRRTTARTQLYTGTFLLTEDQRQSFVSFFQDELKDGALSFSYNDVVDGTASFRFDPGSPYSLTALSPSQWHLNVTLAKL